MLQYSLKLFYLILNCSYWLVHFLHWALYLHVLLRFCFLDNILRVFFHLIWRHSDIRLYDVICHVRSLKSIFSFARDIWLHNYVTSWWILLIDVSMVRDDQYLSIVTEIKFIQALIAKMQGKAFYTKIPWLLKVSMFKNTTCGKSLVLQFFSVTFARNTRYLKTKIHTITKIIFIMRH